MRMTPFLPKIDGLDDTAGSPSSQNLLPSMKGCTSGSVSCSGIEAGRATSASRQVKGVMEQVSAIILIKAWLAKSWKDDPSAAPELYSTYIQFYQHIADCVITDNSGEVIGVSECREIYSKSTLSDSTYPKISAFASRYPREDHC